MHEIEKGCPLLMAVWAVRTFLYLWLCGQLGRAKCRLLQSSGWRRRRCRRQCQLR